MANIFKNAGIEVLAARTTLYTCPVASTAVLHALYLSNVDGTSPVDADIEITIDGLKMEADILLSKTYKK
mgnify:CR=1 FL=1